MTIEKLKQIMDLSPELRAHRLRLLTVADMEWLVTQAIDSVKEEPRKVVYIDTSESSQEELETKVEEVKEQFTLSKAFKKK